MKSLVLLLAISAVASALDWTDLRIKWNTKYLDPLRINSFYEIPRTVDDAVSASWVEVTGINSLDLTTYCYPNDGQFCVLLDGYGHIAGFQFGLLRSDVDVAGNVYKTSNFEMCKNKTIFDDEYVTITIYTVNPTIIKAGGRSDWSNLTGTDGIWIEQTDDYWEIPKNLTDLPSAWITERCIAEMGTHYYYNMSTSTDCVNFLPVFLMYDQDGVLIGGGVQAFGSCTIKTRSWCEWVPELAMAYTVPTHPECLATWSWTYGIISSHFYFNEKPWNYTC